MIGIRQTEDIYLIKDLPFTQWLFGLSMIISSSIFLLIYILKWFLVSSQPSSAYIALNLGALIVGVFVICREVTTVTLINKGLGVITISKRSAFSTSYTQYGFAEINGDFYVKEAGILGGLLLTYRIQLPLKKDSVVLAITGKTFFFNEILSEAAVEANKFLLRESNISEVSTESPS